MQRIELKFTTSCFTKWRDVEELQREEVFYFNDDGLHSPAQSRMD